MIDRNSHAYATMTLVVLGLDSSVVAVVVVVPPLLRGTDERVDNPYHCSSGSHPMQDDDDDPVGLAPS